MAVYSTQKSPEVRYEFTEGDPAEGALVLVAQGATAIYLHTPDGSSGPDLVVRGVPYRVSGHFRLEDGRWQVGPYASGSPDAHNNPRYLNIYRTDRAYDKNDPTRPQVQRIEALLIDVIRQWTEHDPLVLLKAESVRLNNEAQRAEAEVARVEAEYSAALDKLADAAKRDRESSRLLREAAKAEQQVDTSALREIIEELPNGAEQTIPVIVAR